MTMKPLISVIIPVHNSEETLQRAIESVLHQNSNNNDDLFELIMVENGSTDDSATIVKKYTAKHENLFGIYLIQGNRSHARNMGISKARGEYLVFLDADDELKPGYFEEVAKITARLNSDFLVPVYSETQYMDDVHQQTWIMKIDQYNTNQLEYQNIFPIQSVAVPRKLIKVPFDESMTTLEDWKFWIDNLYNLPIKKVKKPLSIVHITGRNSLKDAKKAMRWWFVVRAYFLNHFGRKTIKSYAVDFESVIYWQDFIENDRDKQIVKFVFPSMFGIAVFMNRFPLTQALTHFVSYRMNRKFKYH